jgi:acyl phosphate:glycerol-3-phosphate acyltransferase
VSPVQHYFVTALTTLVSYFIGGIPFGYWFVRITSGEDIRKLGSGNIGATNVHRTRGRKAGLIVLLLDILKGFVAVFITAKLTRDDSIGVALSTIAVILGHCYPVLLRFKGGKAVACFVGAFLYIAPAALAITTVVYVLVVALSKYISLASILCAALFPLVLLMFRPAPAIFAASVFSSLLVIYRHKANIERLRRGQENVFSLKGGKVV